MLQGLRRGCQVPILSPVRRSILGSSVLVKYRSPSKAALQPRATPQQRHQHSYTTEVDRQSRADRPQVRPANGVNCRQILPTASAR